MKLEKLDKMPPPPGVIGSLRAGFDVVSTHVWLILVPVLLDVYLWLGPRLSIGGWFKVFITSWIDFITRYGVPDQDITIYTTNAPILMEHFEELNWMAWIRTIPIGIPALMLDLPENFPVQTPLGLQSIIHLNSFVAVMGSLAFLTLIGWLAGVLYFRIVAGATLGRNEAGIGFLRAFVQSVILSVIWFLGGVVILTPILLLLVLLTRISPILGNTILIVIFLLAYWLVIPLVFTPHGIYVHRQNAIFSILSSMRMSRFALPSSGMFVLSSFILWIGLDYLWKIPKNDSWMTLIGISGHAFITTALLAASLVYYRDMNVWIQHALEQLQQKQSAPTQQA